MEATIKRVDYKRYAEWQEEPTDEFYYVPVLASPEDELYLELKGGFCGFLHHFFEQGMDHGLWMLYNPKFMTDTGHYEYEGQFEITAGSYLRIFDLDGMTVYEHVVEVPPYSYYARSKVEQFEETNPGFRSLWFEKEYPAIWYPE